MTTTATPQPESVEDIPGVTRRHRFSDLYHERTNYKFIEHSKRYAIISGSFMVLEVVGGWLSGSLALLADAGHMLTDVGALGLSLLTAWIAQRPADASKTYGYLRWEILAALVNGAALFGIAGWVVLEAIQRMQHPGPIRSGLFLAVAAAGLVVNVVGLAMLHGARHGSLNARGAYLHVMSDALGSVAALTAAAIIWLTGWTLADPIASIVLSLLILVGAWRLLRESTDILLDAVPRHVAMTDVQRRILGVPGLPRCTTCTSGPS